MNNKFEVILKELATEESPKGSLRLRSGNGR